MKTFMIKFLSTLSVSSANSATFFIVSYTAILSMSFFQPLLSTYLEIVPGIVLGAQGNEMNKVYSLVEERDVNS